MHDLMHDLAISIAGEFYFRSEELGKVDEMSLRTRHLSCGRFSHPISKSLDAIGRVKSLRTFLPINFSNPSFSIQSSAFIIISKLKYLRVLSFHFFQELDALPHSIGELIHLRYLDLSHTSIKTLPESLSDFYNLQTLKLYNCYKLTMLPSGMQNLVNLRHLDIHGTVLEEMPRRMRKLKHLRILSDFVVGKHEENGIKEFGELSNLHESLWIRKLENVTNSNEALEARIMDKKHIDNLYFEWSSRVDMVTTSQTERDIFDKLQPHKVLKELIINCYRGTRFPDWVGRSSYHNMTRVNLESCSNCCMLPSLGRLPYLKSLRIAYFNGLETIGAEFYKNDNDHSSLARPFPSLEYLSFDKMSCLEVWRSFEFDAFPQLKVLAISDCPKLTGDLPNHLHALEVLYIVRCKQLASSLPMAPAIRELQISKSDKLGLQELPISLQSLSIGGCQLAESWFKAITIPQPTCFQSLHISYCLAAISFPALHMHPLNLGISSCLSAILFLGDCIPASVKKLGIRDCKKLEFPMQNQHEFLESISISNSCDSLTSFPLENFPNLKDLRIHKCENLKSLSVSQDAALENLKRFIFRDCNNFVSFPIEGLAAPSLTSFSIYNCDKLKSLPSHMNTLLPKLERLSISDCPEIESFPERGLPPNLRVLEIRNCEKLLSCLASINLHEVSLTILRIVGPCQSVKSFPKEGLLPQLPSLSTLELHGFSSLETLECKGLIHLTSLQHLTIEECPKLENMVGEKLPASLIKLNIYGSPLLEKQCQVKHVEIWPRISHICRIRVNGTWI